MRAVWDLMFKAALCLQGLLEMKDRVTSLIRNRHTTRTTIVP